MDLRTITEEILQWLLAHGPRLVLILVLTLVALRLPRMIANRLASTIKKKRIGEEGEKRAETLSSVVRYVLATVIGVVAGITLLDELGVRIGPILAAAGVVGVAVGFGAQHLVQDVIGGFFILIEDQIRVGDVVQVAGRGGLVEKVNIRMTILRDLSGNVHYVRNSQIDVVTNMTKEFSRYVLDIGVAYREDVDEVIEVIRQVDEELRSDPEYANDITEPVEVLGLDEFASSAIVIKARLTTKPIKQWRVGREFKRRLKKRFDERNIEIPFPHLTLYMGRDKTGHAPPLTVVSAGEAPAGGAR